MENTTDIESRLAMAKMLYLGMQGLEIDQKTRLLSTEYSRNLFSSPWRDAMEPSTQAYGSRFFEALHLMGNTTNLVERWHSCFDRNGLPNDPLQARSFISDFFRVLLHHPREYHNFVSQRRDVTRGGVLDFPIEHPISVEFWAVYITISGAASLRLESETISLGPNSVVIIAPGCNCTLLRCESEEHWSYDWLSFRSRLEWIELLEWATALTRPIAFEIDEPNSFSWITQQTERLESTTYAPDTLSERLCNNIIENILLSFRIVAEDQGKLIARTNTKIQGAVDFILNNYGDDISLQDIAYSVNSSPGRLSTLFREHFGISVIKWRDRIRMQKAKELIIHSQYSIGSIANQVGYSDALYFSRRFREHFGVPPSYFRRC
jgi:AraC family transcriptional regulator of arabinose operon